MLKSCCYCGKIHKMGEMCPSRVKRKKLNDEEKERMTETRKFRRSKQWTDKAKAIKERDGWHCLVCESKYYGKRQINTCNLEVHHIVKLFENEELRADDNNLITLCREHHKMADRGEIAAAILLDLVKQRINKVENYDEFY